MPQPSSAILPYLAVAHRSFATEGPMALRVEALARAVGKNKSSFYHHFGDLEGFTEQLLRYHDTRFAEAIDAEAAAINVAELTQALLDHQEEILFSRQCMLHLDRPELRACLERNVERSIPRLLPLWAKLVGLPERTTLAEGVLRLSLENFFLQLTPDTLNDAWLSNYLSKLHTLVGQLQRSGPVDARRDVAQ